MLTAILAALALIAAYAFLMHSLGEPTRLQRILTAAALERAMGRAQATAADRDALMDATREPHGAHLGQAGCGCWWVYLGEGNAQLFPCDEHEGVLEVGRR